jgi:hypothetical protein
MAKSQGRRGVRGFQGPAGRSGKKGPKGAAGKTGATGARGIVGHVRPVGALTRSDRMEVLTLVHREVNEIYKELEVQMKRMAQLQAQLDGVLSTVQQRTGTPR